MKVEKLFSRLNGDLDNSKLTFNYVKFNPISRLSRSRSRSRISRMEECKTGKVDIWSELVASESEEQRQIQVFYERRRPQGKPHHSHTQALLDRANDNVEPNNSKRSSLAAANKRVSWNRSLSTRGRASIAVNPYIKNEPRQKHPKRRGKPPVPKGKVVELPSFQKEREYFEEVDAFELLEESPSPKNFGTWELGNRRVTDPMPHVSSRLEKWLLLKKSNLSCGPSSTLSKILETPATPLDPINSDNMDSSMLRTPEKCTPLPLSACYEGCEDIDAAIKKLSLASTTSTSYDLKNVDSFSDLLKICYQSSPLELHAVFSKFCDIESIAKIGEGTFGEAFRAGNAVCKIVPFDGDFPVNGEIQKKSEELLEEAVLSQTLNRLREFENDVLNACTTFIETIDLKVCQGPYDAALIRAWEKWDEKNGSENDHPKVFPEKQRYMVFILQHGGKDLESFVLENFDEARSLLLQVTAALAVAEAEYEFEHRDLHWGNILLSRNDSVTLKFILEGKQMFIRTFGLSVSIIDFTLSRINTGENILFLDLSADPYLFKGPKGDKQSETYRKMKEVTEDFWEGSFPRTNVLWLIYLVDILLLKKTFVRTSKNERDLRSLKKRLDKYQSAKEAVFDPFFEDLLVDRATPCE